MKPVFVAGATGGLGFALTERLNNKGVPVRALIRDREHAPHFGPLENVQTVVGDLTQPDSLHELMQGCGVVYHCAGRMAGGNRRRSERVNVEGTEALLEEARRAAVDRFVLISSVVVYGLAEGRDLDEETPWLDSRLVYVDTKQRAERLAWGYADEVPLVVARPGHMFGPRQKVWTVTLIKLIKRRLLHAPRNNGMFHATYIENLVDALEIMGQHPEAVGEAFNVVDGTPLPMHDYIRQLVALARRPSISMPPWLLRHASSLLEWSARFAGRDPFITREAIAYLLVDATFSNAKLRERLGWEPHVGFDEAMAETANWLREQGLIV